MGLDKIGRQRRWSFSGLLEMRIRGRLLESWCMVERGIRAFFYRPREGGREHE
jgi:hypothetical protein